MPNINKFLELYLTKGWKQLGEYNGLPLLQHPKGMEAVIDSITGKLVPKNSLAKLLENRASMAKINARKKELAARPKKIVKFIQTDSLNRNLGELDFSTENWFSYARNIKIPKDYISYYESNFLPQIEKAYNRLVNNNMLYFDPKINKVIGIIEGKPVPLNNTEDKLAYIVINTPNAKHLQFDGDVYATGVPSKHVSSFLKNGGGSKSGRTTWGSSNLGSQSYYRGKGGISGIFTSIKPKLIKKLIPVGLKSHVPNKVIPLTPTASNPTSNSFAGNAPINTILANEPYSYQVTTKPILDEVASDGLNTDVITKMQIIGSDLPIKALLGNSGRYSKTDKNPFNVIINPVLLTGGLGGLAYATTN